jgi:ATP-dependent Clp protease ATP-binding subunit ClpC
VNDSLLDLNVPARRYLRLGITSDPVRRWLPVVFISRPVLRYSEDVRQAVNQAGQEARRLRHDYVGTEHLLLGLISGGDNTAIKILKSHGISVADVRQQVEEIIGAGLFDVSTTPLMPRAITVLQLAKREALRTGSEQVGAEHFMAGLIREGEGVAAQVLVRMGASYNRVKDIPGA